MAHERHKRIIELLEAGGTFHVKELRESLAVSEATIRNDLRLLHEQGLLIRSHGGAQRTERPKETSYEQREVRRQEEKRRIGLRAAQYIDAGETVFFDSGSTVMELAKHVPQEIEFQVVTAALNTAYIAGKNPRVNVHLVGGMLRESLHELVGPKAVSGVREVRASKVFLGVSGFDLAFGLTENHIFSAEVKRAMAASSSQVIVLADSSKLGKVCFAHLLNWDGVDTLITDAGMPPEAIEQLGKQGVDVVVT